MNKHNLRNTIIGGIFVLAAPIIGAYVTYFLTSKQYNKLINDEYIKKSEFKDLKENTSAEIELKFNSEIEKYKLKIEKFGQQEDSLNKVIKTTFIDTIDGITKLAKVLKKDIKIPTGNNSFDAKLTFLELMNSGNIRYNLEFRNKANNAQLYTLQYPKCYLSDEFGNKYSLVATSSNKSLGDFFSHELPGGLKATHWMEFKPPKDDATEFKLHLKSTAYVMNKANYSPIKVSITEFKKKLIQNL